MRSLHAFLCLALSCTLLPAADETGDVFFTSKIAPLLEQRCFECHSHERKIKGGLTLDSKTGWEQGGESGPAIVPGRPEASLLMKAVSYAEKDLRMPPKEQLAPAELALLKEWVTRGAPDPRSKPATTAALQTDASWQSEFRKRLDWWSLAPLSRAKPPVVPDQLWMREPVDGFVAAAHLEAKLAPAPRATPGILLRRLSSVLTGLPPKPVDVEAFAAAAERDPEAAYVAAVDRLLASPHYGERFARHWMDVVRYTDTYGYEWDNPAKGAWEYRDYLIRAFNRDLGFDQLVREQIAGDLVTPPRIEGGLIESMIGPVFYHLGEHRHGSSLDFNGIHQEMVHNKIDAFSKAFLATTVACARCHDHKLEAVPQQDYYALAAVFTVPRWTSRSIDAPGRNDAAIVRLKELRSEIRRELATAWTSAAAAFDAPMLRAWADGNRARLKAAKLEEIGYPLARLMEREGDAATSWADLQREWSTTRDQRISVNRAFAPLGDVAAGRFPAGWVAEGDGMRHGFVEDATPLIAFESTAVVERLLPAGWHTHALSRKLPGALRSPPQAQIPGTHFSAKLAGEGFVVALPVPDHAFQNEPFTVLTGPAPQWKSFADPTLKNGVRQVTVELATAPLNPNFPPRTGLAKAVKWQDFGYEQRGSLSITGLVTHDTPGTPQATLDAFSALYNGAAPASADDAWARIALWLTAPVERWGVGEPRSGDRELLEWLLAGKLLPNEAAPGGALASLVAEYRRIEAAIPFPRTVNGMDERETARAAYPLNVRGNVDAPGRLVAPDFLAMLAGTHQVARATGSGRLELADSLVSPEHPLTARVYVNRVWQWIFGAGLVATPDDFGRLGEKPSHPELLDWLARKFAEEGWSTKRLVRRLVLSETFRQSGAVTAAARERDPANRLLHHYPTRRLEAEGIRDTLLAVAGRLDPRLFGHPILPPRSVEDGQKRLFSGPLDGDGRRSIYLQMSTMAPPRFLVAFNLPDLKLPTGRRDVTNVPSQALTLLNDPFVARMASDWAKRLLENPAPTCEARIREMFLAAFARVPSETELRRWRTALDDFASPGTSGLLHDASAWERLAHAFFNTKEFIYYR